MGQRGFRTRSLTLATMLLDPAKFPKEELAHLYRARWHSELDLRSLKQTLQMDVLRCRTPELARKELWAHVLAYNFIRTVMAQAADRSGVKPREISFKGAVQTLEAFEPTLAMGTAHLRATLYDRLLEAVASHWVGDRPDRHEPRRRKRRPKQYGSLMKPRAESKREMRKGVKQN